MIDSVIVSYDNQSNDIPILIVGKKRLNQSVEIINAFQGNEAVEIINAFQGNEAVELYHRLTTVKKSEDDSNE